MPRNKSKQQPKKGQHGGHRPNSGRPRKLDEDNYTQVTIVLRNDTVDALRSGAGSKFFGRFLQSHLDRFPLPSHEHYVAMMEGKQVYKMIKRKKTPVITGRIPVRAVRRPKPKTESQLLLEKFRREFVPV
jgi:hypothetical protein